MSATPPPARTPRLLTPLGGALFLIFVLALLAAGLSTQNIIKRLDAPPAGTFLVLAGRENALFVKLSQKSVKGIHRAVVLRGQLEVPGESVARPLLVHSRNSAEWEKKIKIPQPGLNARPSDIESNIALLLDVAIPADPTLHGRTVPASFELEMIVPVLDPQNSRLAVPTPDRATWTVQLLIQPPDFLRLYQRINRISLATAGAIIVIVLLRQLVRRLRRRRTAAA